MPTRIGSIAPPPGLYRFLIRLVSPVLLGYTVWRSYKDGGTRYFRERLGLYSQQATNKTNPQRLWVHAASVGEVITVLPLVESWLARSAGDVLFTTGTPTGAAVLAQHNLTGVQHQYLPIDFPGACQRFIQRAQISQAWIVETEIWPWLYSTCAQHGVSLSIINGRLSNKTSKQADGVLASSYRQALSPVRILARSNDDKERFIRLGANPDNVEVAGDLKYSSNTDTTKTHSIIERPYVLAASTHADEETQIAIAWMQAKCNDTLLVIAPRHPERGPAIYEQLNKHGYSVLLRSSNESPLPSHDIYIADTLGELAVLYQYAKGAFVGGSLIERGGHNIMEPARVACPTIVGQHTFNFDVMVLRMQNANALTVAKTAIDIAEFFVRASKNDDELAAMAMNAKNISDADTQHALDIYQGLLF